MLKYKLNKSKKDELKNIIKNQIYINWKRRINEIFAFDNELKKLKNNKKNIKTILIISKKRKNIFLSLVNIMGEVLLKMTFKSAVKHKYQKRWQRRRPDAFNLYLNVFFKKFKKKIKKNKKNLRIIALLLRANKLNRKIIAIMRARKFDINIIKISRPKGFDSMREKKRKRI
jgi:hypothetical protein